MLVGNIACIVEHANGVVLRDLAKVAYFFGPGCVDEETNGGVASWYGLFAPGPSLPGQGLIGRIFRHPQDAHGVLGLETPVQRLEALAGSYQAQHIGMHPLVQEQHLWGGLQTFLVEIVKVTAEHVAGSGGSVEEGQIMKSRGPDRIEGLRDFGDLDAQVVAVRLAGDDGQILHDLLDYGTFEGGNGRRPGVLVGVALEVVGEGDGLPRGSLEPRFELPHHDLLEVLGPLVV
mmetsp:Transcript_12594/g.29868  ORF Transcript_12594/g.29868 Transcript_12594/m.29868 type:complete len:232 (-) Transcript_12594:1126-1821(-)